VLLTAGYTALGGLSAVIVTDVAQAVVLLVGAVCMTAIALSETGGLDSLRGSPPADVTAEAWQRFFHLYRPPDHAHLPTLGIALGQSVAGLWYFCLDQAIVQRVLAARSIDDARGATLLCGFLKTLPIFIMVLPGVAARKLYGAELAGDTNQALPLMMARLLPPGMLGLMLAATVAACMSSLDSVFTAAASLICLDLYRPYVRPHATEREFVLVGRLSCAALAVLTLLWMPVIDLLSDQIFVYVQSISNYLAPPVVAVYFGGVLWKRATVQGATAAFVVGYLLGAGRMLGEILLKTGGATAGPPSVAVQICFQTNYLYIGFFIFVASTSALVLVSLLTPPPPAAKLAGLTVRWRNPFPALFLAVAHCAREPSPAMRSFELTEVGLSEAGWQGRSEVATPDTGVRAGTARQKTMLGAASTPAAAASTPPAQGAQRSAPSARTAAPSPAAPAPPAHATRTLPRRRRGDRFHALNVILSSVLMALSAALIADWW
jgi:Na+/proline symporter